MRAGAPRPLHGGARGLTLTELMVTVVVAFIIVAAVFTMYRNGAVTARAQTQLAQTETQLRVAMSHIWRDAMRAGFRATANSEADRLRNRVCWMPPGAHAFGFTAQRNHGHVHLPGDNVQVQPTSFTYFGDLFSPGGHQFRSGLIDTDRREILLSPDSLTLSMSKAQFETIFRPGVRWVRVVNHDGLEWYAQVVGATFETLTLELSGTPGPGPCQPGMGANQEVSPVGWIQYRVAPEDELGALLGPGGPERVMGKTNLVREEVDAAGMPVPGTQLVVAEYVVDLQLYDLVFDESLPGDPNTVYLTRNFIDQVTDESGTSGLLARGDLSARPQDLRFFTVKLGVRTPEEDPHLVFQPRPLLYGPLHRYEVDADLSGSARVLSQAKRIELRNFWLRRR